MPKRKYTNGTTYASLEQMQGMEFGVTGATKRFDKNTVAELLVGDDGLFGWAMRYDNDEGEMIDWDSISENEARELKLPL